ncbi:MAG: PAS domain S-box protein [Coleofasciculaceae cyanobacterium]
MATSLSRRKLQSDFSVRWQGTLIIAIPVFCLLASVLMITALRAKTIEGIKRQDQSRRLLLETQLLSLALSNARMSVRGYALTEQQEFLNPYFQAKKTLPTLLQSLQQQVKSNSLQDQQLQKIIRKSQQQVQNIDKLKIINERQNKSALIIQLRENELLMNQLNQEINKFTEQEQQRYNLVKKQVEQSRELTNLVQWSTLAISILSSVAALYLFNKLDKKLVERAIDLRDSKLYLQEVFDNVVDGIIILNERGYIQSTNRAAESIFGYDSQEIPGKHLQRLIAESFTEDSGRVIGFLVGNNQNKLHLQQEAIGLRKDGTTFPMEFAMSKMQLDDQSCFIAIVRDITSRKQAQETLLKQAQLLDLANDTIMVRDLNDTILYWNQGAERLYGFTTSEALNQSVHVLLKTEFSQSPEVIKQILLQEGHWNGELIHYRQDGTAVTVASSLTLQCNEFDEPLAYLEINQDITQRKKSEAALQKSEEQYRTLVKNFPNGAVFLFDEQLRYSIAEGTGLATANLTSEALTGKTIWELLPTETVAIIEPIYRAALQGEVNVTEITFGNRFYLLYALPITNSEGKITSGMAMYQDITANKQAEVALKIRAEELAQMTNVLEQTTTILEKRNSELDQFAYIVSHDLKAPLRAVANLCQWIEEDIDPHLTTDTRHQLELMRNRVQRMEALISGLLQYSRIGRIQTELETVDVGELLIEIIDSIGVTYNAVTIMPGMPKLRTERLLLQQVFTNLISNAIKHNKSDDPQVVISAKEQQKSYEFAVTDNGKGIAPELHDKVFIIFQIGNQNQAENTGIGLAIVKKIVEDRGGTISLESQLGKGATFRFTWLKQIFQEGSLE